MFLTGDTARTLCTQVCCVPLRKTEGGGVTAVVQMINTTKGPVFTPEEYAQ